MTTIRIDDIMDSKTGKSWRVKSGDKWYGASKDLLSASDKGKVFEVKISASDFGPWIDSAKAPETAPIAAKTGLQASNGSGVAPWYMPFISNCVAHAISAGLVKEPTDVKVWVLAAKQAAESMDDVPY
jgi:hypothetical protein